LFSLRADVTLKSIEKHQKQKNDLLLPFEKQALEDTGRYENQELKKEADRKSAEHYWQVVSRKILEIDLEMIETTEDLSRQFHLWSIFNPVTFYKSVNNELGSRGYNSYNKFFRDNLEIQRGFLRYIFDNRYYNNYSKVEPYLPEDQLVVKAKPRLPRFYWPGLIVTLFYFFVAVFIGFFIFERHMYPKPETPRCYQEVVINAAIGKTLFVSCQHEDLSDQLVNVFSGFPYGFNGKILLDNIDIKDKQIPFEFIPNQAQVPGNIKVRQLLTFIQRNVKISKENVEQFKHENQSLLNKRFNDLEPWERAEMLVDLCSLKDTEIFILKDFTNGIHHHNTMGIIRKLDKLKKKDVLLLCLSDDFMSSDKIYLYSFLRDQGKYIDIEKHVKNK
jgi:hypothetical protein